MKVLWTSKSQVNAPFHTEPLLAFVDMVNNLLNKPQYTVTNGNLPSVLLGKRSNH